MIAKARAIIEASGIKHPGREVLALCALGLLVPIATCVF